MTRASRDQIQDVRERARDRVLAALIAPEDCRSFRP
jgi:hypothetical protein